MSSCFIFSFSFWHQTQSYDGQSSDHFKMCLKCPLESTKRSRLEVKFMEMWGLAQRLHSCFPPSSPGFESRLSHEFFLSSLLLNLWTIETENHTHMRRISQMQCSEGQRKKVRKKFNEVGKACSISVWCISTKIHSDFQQWFHSSLLGK